MKFDVVVGNPPYQEENKDRNRDDAVYPYFMESAYSISDKAILITPGRFLFNVGSTSKRWNDHMLKDKHLTVPHYETNSENIFSNTDIKGGIAITYRDSSRILGPIGVFTPHKELQSILEKVDSVKSEIAQEFGDIMYVQNKLDLPNVYSKFPELKEKIGSKGKERRLISSAFDKLPEIFSDEKDVHHNIGIYGRQDGQRVYKFINENFVGHSENLLKWKVFVPAANGSGALGEVLSTPVIGHPVIGHTQTFISIGSFETEYEAVSCLKYIKGKFSRAMLGVLKVTQNNKTKETWSKVPLQDFTPASDIDWSQSIADIDQQLYKKYGLNEEEITFIETHVKEME